MFDTELVEFELQQIAALALTLSRNLDVLWKLCDQNVLEILESHPSILGFDGHHVAKEIQECIRQIKQIKADRETV